MSQREERLRSLKQRLNESSKANRAAVYEEHKKLKQNPRLEGKLEKAKERAELELEKLEAKESGEDFERHRAWDWTIEESEAWDKKVEEKRKQRENEGFSDYSTFAEKAYQREIKELTPDLEKYQKQKLTNLAKRALVFEDEEGNVIAYDENDESRKGLDYINEKPPKDAIDRLVSNLKKSDQRRMKRRKPNDEDESTYINDKNRQFNQKLSRHYDKYTQETKDSFERGTAL